MATELKNREITLDIEPADWDDMELVAEFIRSTADWYEPFLDEKDLSEHYVDEEWKKVNFERRDFYIGRAEGIPVGSVSLQYFGDYAYVGYVYLDSDYVGHGFGRQLLSFAADKAKAQGMKGVALIAHPEAQWATKAYTKFGFQRVASNKEDVLKWNDGILKDYYEEGFELYIYPFDEA